MQESVLAEMAHRAFAEPDKKVREEKVEEWLSHTPERMRRFRKPKHVWQFFFQPQNPVWWGGVCVGLVYSTAILVLMVLL